MKTNDLMVGDYISVKPSGMPIKVAAVHHKKVAYHAVINKLSWVRESLLEPIPLTQEILEKNGLEKDNHGRLYGEYFDEDINDDLEITVDDKTGEIWWSYNWNEYYIIRLRYVHQLQNALRLCGIKKEIKL
jgi:hypothetical protein